MHVCSCISLKLMPVLNTFCWLLAITSYIHNWQLKNYRMCLKLFSDRGFILSLNHIPSSQIISCKSFNKQLFAIWQLLFKLKNQLQWETLTQDDYVYSCFQTCTHASWYTVEIDLSLGCHSHFPQPHILYRFRLKLNFSATSSFFLTTLSFSLTADCIITVAVVMSQLYMLNGARNNEIFWIRTMLPTEQNIPTLPELLLVLALLFFKSSTKEFYSLLSFY